MPISSTELFSFTQSCFSDDAEVNYRDIVSVGYYGMYHKTLSVLKFYKVPKQNCHVALIKYLSDPSLHHEEPFNSKILGDLSYLLRQERAARVIADYELNDKRFSRRYAESAMTTHRRYLQKIDSLSK